MLDLNKKTILVIAPHPDDETLGCGGFMLKAAAAGAKVHVLIMCVGNTPQYGGTSNTDARKKETAAVMKALKVTSWEIAYASDEQHLKLDMMPKKDRIDRIEKGGTISIESIKPDIVLIPWKHSCNQDHEATFDAALSACRPRPGKATPSTVLAYEQPDSYWSHAVFTPNVYVDISEHIDAKIKALALYKSQIHKSPHPVCEEMVRAMAAVRGHSVGVRAAEAFCAMKIVF